MKTRTGFVSNSSSSSFIIHRSYLTDDQVSKLEDKYNELKDKDMIYNDGDESFYIHKNYIEFGAYGGDGVDIINKMLDKFGVKDDQILTTEG